MTTCEYKIIAVTPALAQKWLKKNHAENRAVSWSRVESYANDMRANVWMLSPQGIIFDTEGTLIDGQHRLHAIVAANVTVRLSVFEGHELEIHGPIDQGMPRSVATILGLHSRRVAALSTLRGLEQGVPSTVRLTSAEAQSLHERYAPLLDRFDDRVRGKQRLVGPFIGACVWAMPCDEHLVLDFANKVSTGEMIAKRDPAYVFRAWKQKSARAQAWATAMATLNCARYHVHGLRLASVFTGEMGYRAVTTRRRALKVPHTPHVDIVPTANWMPRADGPESTDGSES